MLKAFEQKVSDTLDALEDEGLVNPHEETENYDELADLVRGRIGNFHEWKASKRRLRGVGEGVKGLEIEMQDELPRGERIQGAFRLVSSPVDAASNTYSFRRRGHIQSVPRHTTALARSTQSYGRGALRHHAAFPRRCHLVHTGEESIPYRQRTPID